MFRTIVDILWNCMKPITLYGGGGGGGVVVFPNDAGTDNATGVFREMTAGTLGVWEKIKTAQALTPYDDETVPDPDDTMGSASAGLSQYELNAQRTRLAALDEDGDYRGFIEQAVAEADESDSFPAVSIATDAVSIHTATRTAITSMITSAATAAAASALSVHSSERTNVSSAMTSAIAAAIAVVNDDNIKEMTDAYEDRTKKQYLRAKTRLAAGMSDINAVNSSAFIFGMASIDRQWIEDVNNFDSQTTNDLYKTALGLFLDTFKTTFTAHIGTGSGGYIEAFNNAFSAQLREQGSLKQLRSKSRDDMVMQASEGMARLQQFKVNSYQAYNALQIETNKIKHDADTQEMWNNLTLEVEAGKWDLDLFSYGANMLASASGASVTPLRPSVLSQITQAAGGILTGAAALVKEF